MLSCYGKDFQQWLGIVIKYLVFRSPGNMVPFRDSSLIATITLAARHRPHPRLHRSPHLQALKQSFVTWNLDTFHTGSRGVMGFWGVGAGEGTQLFQKNANLKGWCHQNQPHSVLQIHTKQQALQTL